MTAVRSFIFFYSILCASIGYGQTSEDFEDGDFADGSPLTWTTSQTSGGNDFVIADGELQSNGPEATSSLFASSNLGIDFTTNDVVWTFKVRYEGGAPSSSNFMEIYLMSDIADVSGSPQGYYVRLGESGSSDGIDLFSSDGDEVIISDTGDQVSVGIDAHIRVSRTATGDWTLEADASGGDTFTTIGTVSNTDFSSGDYFGLFVKHSSTRNEDFFMDDVIISITPIPDTTSPAIQSITVVSETEVDVLFSENVDQTIAETNSNYSFDKGISVSSAALDASNSSLVHLTTSSLTNGTTYTVTINSIEDESGNVIVTDSQETFEYLLIEEAEVEDVVVNEFHASASDGSVIPNAEFIELLNVSDKYIQLENWTFSDATGTSSSFTSFVLAPDEYLILTATGNGTLFESYGDVLEVSSFRALNNGGDDITLTNSSATTIFQISYTSSSSGVSTELINPNGPDYSSNNYGLSSDTNGGTPGAVNSIFDDTPDTTLPTIENITIISQTELDVLFSEPLQEGTSETPVNYTIDGDISVTSADRDDSNSSLVHLVVSSLVSGEVRTLTVNNVTDLSENAIASNSTIDFEYLETEEAAEGDLVVNEFYASPNEDSTIPNVEFVELFNRSDKFIDMENWTFSDQSSTSSAFGSFILRPDSFLILTETDNGDFFDSDFLEVGNFPALNNGGDSIIIKNGSSVTIHEIKYSGSTSGITTELINPNGPDYSFRNYGLSTNTDGGTPGTINSIFDDTPDTTAPTLDSIAVISQTQLEIFFNEQLEETSAETLSNYTIDGGITVGSALLDDSDNTKVHLVVSELISAETRTLTVNNVADLSGNVIASSDIDFRYITVEAAEEGDVVINEFHASPNSESIIPNKEFIELFNLSDKYIDVENWTYSDATDTSSSFPSFVLEPDSFLILTTTGSVSLFESYGDVIGVVSFRSLNSSDQIIISDSTGLQIHQISYSSATSGITTELINPNGPDYSSRNYGLSTNTDGGTPGSLNSIFDDTPDTTSPTIESIDVISSTELTIIFNEPLEKASSENIDNYTIDGDVSVNSALLYDTANNVVQLIVSALTSTQERIITINNVADLSGNLIAANSTIEFEYIATEVAEGGDILINEFLADPVDNNDDFIELWNVSDKFIELTGWKIRDNASTSVGFSPFIIRPNEYVIIYDEDAIIDYSSFGNAITIPSLTLNNQEDQIEILNESGSSMVLLEYLSQPSEGISSELINPNDPCLTEASYGPSISESGSSPGAVNSIFDETPDTSNPTIIGYTFDESLTLYFSETMDVISLQNGTYEVEGLTISALNVEGTFPNSLSISFNETLVLGTVYELTVTNVTDCWSNAIQSTTVIFGIGRKPQFNEVFITEIMADPDPPFTLPDREYIELYNSTNDILNLEGMVLSDESSSTDLPSISLNPFSYVVITTNTGASEFENGAIGISNFTSLSNSGEQLSLSLNSQLIFSVTYDVDWHSEEVNKVGGTALEMIDVANPCAESNNWTSSVAFNRGTPGAINSVSGSIPDNFPPEIEVVIAVSADSIRIDFTEKIDPSSTGLVDVVIQPEVNISRISFNHKTPRSLYILVSEDLLESTLYLLSISNVIDCAGNIAGDLSQEFALPSVPMDGQILLSEILFNPNTNGVDFVELHNNSDFYLDLKGWQIANISDEGIDNAKIISEDQLVLPPRGFIALTTNSTILFNNYPKANRENFHEMASLPGYSDSDGDVVLINQNGEEQESFSYDSDFHYSLLKSVNGVSLERISYESPNNRENWRSASSTVGFATPGYANSQSFQVASPKGTVDIEPKVFLPGNTGTGRDFTTINYQLETTGQFANIAIYDQSGRLVKTLAEGVLLSTSGFFRWDGTTNSGGVARLGYYLVLFEVYDSTGNTDVLKETVVVGRDF